jgi:hypothetical protein
MLLVSLTPKVIAFRGFCFKLVNYKVTISLRNQFENEMFNLSGMPDPSENRHSSSLPHRPSQASLPPDHTTAYPYTAAMAAGGVAESHQPNYIACLVSLYHRF